MTFGSALILPSVENGLVANSVGAACTLTIANAVARIAHRARAEQRVSGWVWDFMACSRWFIWSQSPVRN